MAALLTCGPVASCSLSCCWGTSPLTTLSTQTPPAAKLTLKSGELLTLLSSMWLLLPTRYKEQLVWLSTAAFTAQSNPLTPPAALPHSASGEQATGSCLPLLLFSIGDDIARVHDLSEIQAGEMVEFVAAQWCAPVQLPLDPNSSLVPPWLRESIFSPFLSRQQQVSSQWSDMPRIGQAVQQLSRDCMDLLNKIFVVDEKTRISIQGIKEHPW